MPRLSMTYTLPVILFAGGVLLFVHKWSTGPSTPETPVSTAAVTAPTRSEPGLREGSGANPPPATSMDTTPAGTPPPPATGNTPPSATPRAPSGEPARLQQGR